MLMRETHLLSLTLRIRLRHNSGALEKPKSDAKKRVTLEGFVGLLWF